MSDFIATLKPALNANWEICKREQLWGIVGRGSNWRKNAGEVMPGDRIFVWQGGRPNGFIAEIEARGYAEFVGRSTNVPWPDPHWFGAVLPMRVVHEVATPLSDRFPNENRRNGLRYGFNNTVLQHIFEEIPASTAEKIASDFKQTAII